MKNIEPPNLKNENNLTVYFSLLDDIFQEKMAVKERGRYLNNKLIEENTQKRIEQNLKAVLLLNKKVIFRAINAVNSAYTEKIVAGIIKEAPKLFENQALVPEVRSDGEDTVENILRKRKPNYFVNLTNEEIKNKKYILDYLCSLKTNNKIDAELLSSERSVMMFYNVFRFVVKKNKVIKKGINTSDLSQLYNYLFNCGIPDRKLYENEMYKIFSNRIDATHFIQFLYFGLGARYNDNASPIWTHEIDPANSRMSKPLVDNESTFLNAEDLSSADLKIAKKLKFNSSISLLDLIEKYNEDIKLIENRIISFYKYSASERNAEPNIFINQININPETLNNLTWKDIEDIRRTNEYNNLVSAITSREISDKENTIYKNFELEKQELEKYIHTIEKWSGPIKIYSGLLSLGNYSYIPEFATVMGAISLGSELIGSNAKRISRMIVPHPISSFSELVQRKSLKK